jgi:acyl-CoA thioesterase
MTSKRAREMTTAVRHSKAGPIRVLGAPVRLSDTVAGRSLDPSAGGGITVEMKTSFVQPGFAGSRLTASGHAFHRSSTLAFCEGEVRDETGRLIARSMGTFKYIRQRPADQPADGQ